MLMVLRPHLPGGVKFIFSFICFVSPNICSGQTPSLYSDGKTKLHRMTSPVSFISRRTQISLPSTNGTRLKLRRAIFCTESTATITSSFCRYSLTTVSYSAEQILPSSFTESSYCSFIYAITVVSRRTSKRTVSSSYLKSTRFSKYLCRMLEVIEKVIQGESSIPYSTKNGYGFLLIMISVLRFISSYVMNGVKEGIYINSTHVISPFRFILKRI